MSKFREVLKNKNFLLLWIGQIISQLGDRLDQMALIAFVSSRASGSSIQIAKILSFTIIPVFLIGPLAGAYVDRWDRRRTMYISDLLRSILVLMIPLFLFYSKNMTPIYAIVFLVFCIGRFFVPAKLAIVPDLVDKKDILMANSLVNVTGMIAAIIGFGISGVVVEWLGAKSGFFLDSFSFFISALLIFFISRSSGLRVGFKKMGKEIVEVISKSLVQEMKEGFVYFFRRKEIRFTAAVTFMLFSALGAVYVVVIVFVQNVLHSVTKDLGLLAMFLGIGLFLGSLLYGKFGQRLSQYKTIFASLISSGIMLMVFATTLARYPFFYIAALLSLLLGMSISPIMIATNTIIHKASDSEMRGKIFSSLEIVMHLGFLMSMFISSYLAEHIPQESILVTVGAFFSLVGLGNLIFNRKLSWSN